MENILLSIIIPCYNSYRLMSRSLDMLSKFAGKDIEVIVVDDCSSDGSYDALLNYALTSNINLKVMRNSFNMGPGASRNHGIQAAKGKYLTFLDADDYLTDNFFSVIIPVLVLKPDSVVFDYQLVADDTVYARGSAFFTELSEGEVSTKKALVYVKGSTCGKIYKKSIIVDNEVVFLTQNRNEDMPFTKVAIANCQTIVYIKKDLYCYVQHAQSLMHDSRLLDPKNAQNAFYYIESRLIERYLDEVEAIYMLEYYCSTALTNINFMGRSEWKKYVEKMEQRSVRQHDNAYLKNYTKNIRIMLWLVEKKAYYAVKAFVFVKRKLKR